MAIQRRVRRIWLVLSISIAFVSCRQDSPGVIQSEPVQKLYKRHCALCHGMDGKLGAAGAGDLTQSVITHEEIVLIITYGKSETPGKVMTPFKDVLSAEEIEAMATFVKGLRAI